MAKIKSKKVHYYVFESVETKYHNKHGKLVTYTRTARLDKNDLIENIAKQLQILAEKYLLHCFFVVNDKCYRKKFLDQTALYIVVSLKILPSKRKNRLNQHISPTDNIHYITLSS